MPFESPEEWESELSQFMDTVKANDPPGSIADCVRDDTWRQILAYYANENYVMENVAFISAMLPYAGTGSMDMGVGKQIYDQFIRPGSAQEVNISSAQRKALQDIYEEAEPIAPPDHYDAAFQEVVSMCNNDTYQRFKNTAAKVKEHLNAG